MHMLLQTAVGVAETSSSWAWLQIMVSGIVASILSMAGIYASNYFKGKGDVVKKDLELKSKELELKQLEVEEKIGAIRRRIALDAAAIAQETSLARKEPLSGSEKAQLAAAKVEELLSESAAPNVEGSKLTDLVKLGVAEMRSTYLLSPSMAPPPEHVTFPKPPALPAIQAPPVHTPATKTSPERPGAKR